MIRLCQENTIVVKYYRIVNITTVLAESEILIYILGINTTKLQALCFSLRDSRNLVYSIRILSPLSIYMWTASCICLEYHVDTHYRCYSSFHNCLYTLYSVALTVLFCST